MRERPNSQRAPWDNGGQAIRTLRPARKREIDKLDVLTGWHCSALKITARADGPYKPLNCNCRHDKAHLAAEGEVLAFRYLGEIKWDVNDRGVFDRPEYFPSLVAASSNG